MVLFTRSLHHLQPLVSAVERAHQLLEPGGLLVADDFAVDQADRATAAYFYDARSLLVAAGALSEVHFHQRPFVGPILVLRLAQEQTSLLNQQISSS